jgi:hypothetical protein
MRPDDRSQDHLLRQGYIVKTAQDYSVEPVGEAWDGFRAYWDDLPLDEYLPAAFGKRFRRHACFHWDREFERLILIPGQTYLQSEKYNPVAGGVLRRFPSTPPDAAFHTILLQLLSRSIGALPIMRWRSVRINAHLIRIISGEDLVGCPCPEGIHSDGFPFISIHLIARSNISGAESELYDADDRHVASVTLANSLDSLIVADPRLKHYTSNFTSMSDGLGFRDVLLLSYENEG